MNGVNLAEIQESEVALTNLYSSNGPDFILHVKFSCSSTIAAASVEAHARVKCAYFPIVKGKESIDSILEMLSKNAPGQKKTLTSFHVYQSVDLDGYSLMLDGVLFLLWNLNRLKVKKLNSSSDAVRG